MEVAAHIRERRRHHEAHAEVGEREVSDDDVRQIGARVLDAALMVVVEQL